MDFQKNVWFSTFCKRSWCGFFLSDADLGAASSRRSVTVGLRRGSLPQGPPTASPPRGVSPVGLGSSLVVPPWRAFTHAALRLPARCLRKKVQMCCTHSVPVLCGRHSGPRWFWRLRSFWPAWQPRCRSVHLGLLEWKRCALFSHCLPGGFVAVPVSCLSEAPDSCPGCRPLSWSARL